MEVEDRRWTAVAAAMIIAQALGSYIGGDGGGRHGRNRSATIYFVSAGPVQAQCRGLPRRPSDRPSSEKRAVLGPAQATLSHTRCLPTAEELRVGRDRPSTVFRYPRHAQHGRVLAFRFPPSSRDVPLYKIPTVRPAKQRRRLSAIGCSSSPDEEPEPPGPSHVRLPSCRRVGSVIPDA